MSHQKSTYNYYVKKRGRPGYKAKLKVAKIKQQRKEGKYKLNLTDVE